MYPEEDIEFEHTKSNWDENQDGRQIPKCLPKIDQFNLSQVLF